MVVEFTPVLGLLISVIGIISAISYKFYRDTRKDHNILGFDKGKLETTVKFLKEELVQLNTLIVNIKDDIEKSHMDYDTIQNQMTDIRERIARMEGPR